MKYTIKDNNGNLICSVEEVNPVNSFSLESTLESIDNECAKLNKSIEMYSIISDTRAMEAFGYKSVESEEAKANKENIFKRMWNKIKSLIDKFINWCKKIGESITNWFTTFKAKRENKKIQKNAEHIISLMKKYNKFDSIREEALNSDKPVSTEQIVAQKLKAILNSNEFTEYVTKVSKNDKAIGKYRLDEVNKLTTYYDKLSHFVLEFFNHPHKNPTMDSMKINSLEKDVKKFNINEKKVEKANPSFNDKLTAASTFFALSYNGKVDESLKYYFKEINEYTKMLEQIKKMDTWYNENRNIDTLNDKVITIISKINSCIIQLMSYISKCLKEILLEFNLFKTFTSMCLNVNFENSNE